MVDSEERVKDKGVIIDQNAICTPVQSVQPLMLTRVDTQPALDSPPDPKLGPIPTINHKLEF